MAEIGGKKLTTGEIVIIASGAVAFLFSFFNFYKVDFGGETEGTSAWGDGLFPIATFVAVFGLVMALQIVLTKFANMNLPAKIVDFTWPQVHLILGVFSALIMLGYLIIEKGGLDFGIGFWLMLLGSIGLVVGAVLLRNEQGAAAAAPGTGTAPPTPF